MLNYQLYIRHSNYFEANVFIQHLELNEIPYLVKNEAINTLMPNVFGGIEIWIPKEYFEFLDNILLQIEKEQEELAKDKNFKEDISELNPNNRICVNCNSKNTRIYEKENNIWHCFHCGNKF